MPLAAFIYVIYYMYFGIHILICFMYNIYSIYTDALCVDCVILDVYPCMLLATFCAYLYWVLFCTVAFGV